MKVKVELNVALCCDLSRRKAQKIIMKRFPGVNSISMNMELKKMTVVGDDIDAVLLILSLRKHYRTELLSLHPVRKPEKNNNDRKGDGGGGGSGDRGGDSGRGDGGDSYGGNNNDDHQDPFNQSGGQKGSLFFNLTEYNNWRGNARRVKILMLCFFLEAQRFVLLLRGSAQVFKFFHGEPSERFHRTTADETR